jgi:hypothetical protein
VPRGYKENNWVKVGSNTSTVALRVVGDEEKGTQCLARTSSKCKRQTHLLGREASVQLKKVLVVGLKGLGAKMN